MAWLRLHSILKGNKASVYREYKDIHLQYERYIIINE